MFHSAKDLLKYTIQADDMSADAEDMFVDTRDLKLRHVVVDIGPWFQNRSAVVSAARFGAPDTESRDWPADLTKDEAESAPGLDALREDSDDGVSLPFYPAWPPVIVGVAGETISPLLMQAQVADHLKDEQDEDESRLAEQDRLKSVSSLFGLPVFGPEGQIARLVDLLIDADDMSVHHLVIDTGNLLPQRQMVVPAGVIRHFPRHGEHLVTTLTRRELENSPPLEEVSQIDRNWIDKTLAYYGLQL